MRIDQTSNKPVFGGDILKVISTGSRFDIYSDDLKTYEQLPAGTYTVCFSKHSGFYMEVHAELSVAEKVYGVHMDKVDKVLRSFIGFERNLGVILSGDKGIGKSLFARMLCAAAVKKNIPVLIVDRFTPGIAAYLESIEQEVVVLFDEFDKTFAGIKTGENEADPQAGLLSLFDGVSGGKKLFVVTCNELHSLNTYLVNRPGRFHYHFRFNYPSAAEIREYLNDKLSADRSGEIERVVAFSSQINLNYDCLRAIAFELNTGEDFDSAIADLNIINTNDQRYNAVLHFTTGEKRIAKDVSFDLFDTEEIYFWMKNEEKEMDVRVEFDTEDCSYNAGRGAMIVPGADLNLHWDSDDDEKDKALKQLMPDYLEIRQSKGKRYHYAAV